MSSNRNFKTWLMISLIVHSTSVSYNLPKVCPNATWNINASTFANKSIVGQYPRGIFVDFNDTFYFANYNNNQTLVWYNGSIDSTRNLTSPMFFYTTLFVTINGDIYFENGNEVGRIDKWSINATNSIFVTKFNGNCYGFFIDMNNTLYCSIYSSSQVASISLNNNTNVSTIVAGTGTSGFSSTELAGPWGIFVDMNFDLYIADSWNNRIQIFRPGQRNGTTVAGQGIPYNLTLYFPTDVILDADGYLYIADNTNNRIMQSGTNDFYCVAGCSGSYGSAANQLCKPYSLRFDSHGNIYVADEYNSRIQKFMLETNTCDNLTTSMSTTDMVTSSLTVIQKQDITTETTMISTTDVNIVSSMKSSSSYFIPSSCSNTTSIGLNCNISSTLCDMMQPCENDGICINTNTTILGYVCSCPLHFSGTQCQNDDRLCKPNTCWNNGSCEEISNITFICRCMQGWEGVQCERKVNYCANVTCMNNGVCRPLFVDYKCECLGDSYSGRHCQITGNMMALRQVLSKSLGYIAILCIISFCAFIFMMDILKYCFGIDPARKERQKIQAKKQRKKCKPPVIQRFMYVNAPVEKSNSTTKETIV